MSAGSPWDNDPDLLQARIAELKSEADQNVRRQHFVSRVLLKRFTVPNGSFGHQLYPFDLAHPDRHQEWKGAKACGWQDDFVKFASASLEAIWGRVETRLPAAAAAVEDRSVFDSQQHVEVLKDLIALHFVRSLRFRARHEQIFNATVTEIRRSLVTEEADLLRAAKLQRTGLHLAGPEGLAAAADELLQPHLDNHRSGAELRVRIEAVFDQAREIIGASGLQILTPQAGEFLLGDNPALSIRQDDGTTVFNMALGDSTAVVLPLGPKHLLGGRSLRDEVATIPAAMVDHLNQMQIEAAYRRVYLRPGSGLDRYVRKYLSDGGRSG